jgi:hypothetical protein
MEGKCLFVTCYSYSISINWLKLLLGNETTHKLIRTNKGKGKAIHVTGHEGP